MQRTCETCPHSNEQKLKELREMYREFARSPPTDERLWADYTALMIALEAEMRELGGSL